MVTSVSSARVSSLMPPMRSRALRRKAPTAPGMVGMQPSTSYMRRSRLKPITYSMCCQAPMRVSRLPTLALPATAPTFGSPKGWTSSRTVAASKTVSPSIITMRSWLALARPRLRAAGLPAFCWRTTRTLGMRRSSTMRAVPSLEPSSMTMTSTGWSLAVSEVTVLTMHFASL